KFVAASAQKRCVEIRLSLDEAGVVSTCGGQFETIYSRKQFLNNFLIAQNRRLPPGIAFKKRAHRIKLPRLFRSNGAHHGPTMRMNGYEPFSFELPECLTDRCASNASQLAKVPLGQPFARLEAPSRDRGAQLVLHLKAQRGQTLSDLEIV